MARADSLLGRAVIALALTVGFYVMSLGIVAVLVFLPYQLWQSTGRINAQLTIFCVVSAILILYSIAPRIDVFVEPGPKLISSEHPRLFQLLQRIADTTSQKMPADVYLVPDLNAWVANRGGILGVGSRRVMGLGLPTFQALTVPQFAAVIAHEFGHYHHGDVALGPWLYRVRQGIGRTLQTLEERNNILLIPFSRYGHLFLRVTTAISRRQEFGADALAARLAGRDSLASGLEVIHASSPVFDGFWGTELMPVLLSGKRPPINDGFRRFAEAPRIRDATSALLKAALEAPEDPFDTHPPLAKRLAALHGLAPEGTLRLTSTERATALLGDADRAEIALLDYLIADESRRPQEPIAWSDVGREIWIPIWRQRTAEAGDRLKGIRCSDAGALAADPSYLAVRMGFAARSSVATDEHRYNAAILFGSALSLLLLHRGANLHLEIGDDPILEFRGTRTKPFLVCRDLEAGTQSASEWLRVCQALGIEDAVLAEAVASPAQPG